MLLYMNKIMCTKICTLDISKSPTYFGYVTYAIIRASRVFYEVTEASYLQLQPPCNYMHHLHHSAGLSFVILLVFSAWHLIPILSSDFTCFVWMLPLSLLFDLCFLPLLFLIHHSSVTSWFSQDLGQWQNAWYSKALGVLQNLIQLPTKLLIWFIQDGTFYHFILFVKLFYPMWQCSSV